MQLSKKHYKHTLKLRHITIKLSFIIRFIRIAKYFFIMRNNSLEEKANLLKKGMHKSSLSDQVKII